jgi:delta24-sterol reductase
VDVRNLDAVIGLRQLDDGSWEMLVEPRVTMQQLVRAAAAYNLRPPVVPEFRKITVGGSIAGIAGESSSFKHGFFHDACSGYEIITGDGSILTATPTNEYADLFYATPGSYGSLGIVTAATIKLIPALPFVAMSYTHFDRIQVRVIRVLLFCYIAACFVCCYFAI